MLSFLPISYHSNGLCCFASWLQAACFLLSVNHTLFINQGRLMPQSQKRTDGCLKFCRGAVQFTNQIISVMTDAIDKVQHKLVSKIIQAKYRFYMFHSE